MPVKASSIPDATYRGEILCNRALNMAHISAIGFDMDYTLAEYHADEFELLSARGAIEKLVHEMGYPAELLNTEYDHSYFIRGLIIDKKRGNIIKLDRHKYCKRAMHGFRNLDKSERTEVYDAMTTSGSGFGEPDFAVLDTIFSLPDAYLYATLVDHKDKHPGSISQDYQTIYKDVRRAVDLCHRDGYIKDQVTANPKKFIKRDDNMVRMLERLRRSGRKVFLLTNSLYDYTDAVMRYLYAGENASPEEASKWTDLFDVIIAGSCKPAFMLDKGRQIFRVDPKTYALSNTEGAYRESAADYLTHGKTFQGGNYTHLHKLLDVRSGTQILYVGDHMFSDILKTKRTLGWRTMLIVPELEDEINVQYAEETQRHAERISKLRLERDTLDEHVDSLYLQLLDPEVDPKARSELDIAVKEREVQRSIIIEETEHYHKRFHPVWGQLFKTGEQNSRFAQQVESYACLYTSCVNNLINLSPEMYYRAMADLQPHDRLQSNAVYRIFDRRQSDN